MAKPTLLIYTACNSGEWSHSTLNNLIKMNMLLDNIYYTTNNLTFFSFGNLDHFEDIVLIDSQQEKYISAKELLENKEGYTHRHIVYAHNILKIFLAGGLEMLKMTHDMPFRKQEDVYKSNTYACFTGDEMNAQKLNFFHELCKRLGIDKSKLRVDKDYIYLNDGIISAQSHLYSKDDVKSPYLGNTHVWIDSHVMYNKMSDCILIEPVVGIDTSKLLDDIELLYNTWCNLDDFIQSGDIEVVYTRTMLCTNNTRYIESQIQERLKIVKAVEEKYVKTAEDMENLKKYKEELNELYKKGYEIHTTIGGN
ncbi:MAG: hypothetical protein ACRCRT_06095 [Cetobacterium somerae]